MTDNSKLIELAPPILYSYRRCPYAMRARLAIASSGIVVELREIELRHKPEAMLSISPKGTVPVLQLENGSVIAESLDIMLWALRQNDPNCWLNPVNLAQAKLLVQWNDNEFKYFLDRYKYADRHPEYPKHYYRQQCEPFLAELQRRLNQNQYLCGDHFSLSDAAILPFIRQFAAVGADWFGNAPYPAVNQWLNQFLSSRLFARIMTKYQTWEPNNQGNIFTGEGCL